MKYLSALAALFLMALPAYSGTTMKAGTAADSGIDITYDCWLSNSPQTGHVPIKVTIKNGSPSTHTWNLTFTGGNDYESTIQSSYSMTVQAGHASSMVCYPPVNARPYNSGQYNTLRMATSGYGANIISYTALNSNNTYGSNTTEFIAVSTGAGIKGNYSELVNKFNISGTSSSSEFNGSEVEMKDAPADWRGYSGLAQLWMTESEWNGMSNAQKNALKEWLNFGGRVFILTSDASAERAQALGLPPASADKYLYGAGRVQLITWNGSNLPFDAMVKQIRSADKLTLRAETGKYSSEWPLGTHRGSLTLNGWLIFGFISIFGILAGPINLFVFANGKHRSRLFWTTPVLSLAGSALLITLMVFQDGIGGAGARQTLVILQPDQNKIGLIQEQTSKTGVLIGNSFSMTEPAWMQPLNLDNTYGSDPMDRFQEAGGVRSGDWFSTRAIQSHLLFSVRPSRSGVEFYAPKELGGAPEIVSSMEVPLGRVFIVDDQGNFWQTDSLATGERKSLTASDRTALILWMTDSPQKEAGPVLRRTLDDLSNRPGYVYAEAANAGSLAIPSLDSIDWKIDRLFVAGPYVKR